MLASRHDLLKPTSRHSLMPVQTIFTSPIVQFFAAGAVIFGLYSLSGRPGAEPTDAITITKAEQENISALFQRTWRRPPSASELEALIEARIREELFYREALALGLDDGDVVVRRRLAQKIDFIVDDLAAGRDPSDEELTTFYRENKDRYAIEPLLTFQQVYLSADRRGPALLDDARVILAQLQRGVDPAALGDAIILPRSMERASVREVERVFGEDFAKAIEKERPGEWSGPVRSTYGAHLVKLSDRQEGRLPTFDEARQKIERDWREHQRRSARETYAKALKDKYDVTIESIRSAGE